MINIRSYSKDDKEEVINLIYDVNSEFIGISWINKVKKHFWKLMSKKLPKLDDIYNIEKTYLKEGQFFVAENTEEIVGTAAVRYEDEKTVRMRRLFIQRGFRRRGLGSRLLAKTVKFSRNEGYERMVLATFPVMKGALSFYQKKGFEITGQDNMIHFAKDL